MFYVYINTYYVNKNKKLYKWFMWWFYYSVVFPSPTRKSVTFYWQFQNDYERNQKVFTKLGKYTTRLLFKILKAIIHFISDGEQL